MRFGALRLFAFAALLGVQPLARLGDFLQAQADTGRRRVARVEPAKPARSPLPSPRPALGPFVEVAPFRITPPLTAAVEPAASHAAPAVLIERRLRLARAPPRNV